MTTELSIALRSLPRPRLQGYLPIAPSDLDGSGLTPEVRQRAVERFNQYGYLAMGDVFPRPLIEAMCAAFLERYATPGPEALAERNLLVGDRRVMVTVEVEGPFHDPLLYANPLVHPILSTLLEGDCVINGFGGVVAFPGGQGQRPHRDHDLLFGDVPASVEVAPYAITMVVPLVDLAPAVGTTALWEGSHRKLETVGQILRSCPRVLPMMTAGSVYLMDYRLVHGGLPNRSAGPRPIMYIVYSRRWFRDMRNYSMQDPISISVEAYAQIPTEHRPLFFLAKPHGGAPRGASSD